MEHGYGLTEREKEMINVPWMVANFYVYGAWRGAYNRTILA